MARQISLARFGTLFLAFLLAMSSSATAQNGTSTNSRASENEFNKRRTISLGIVSPKQNLLTC